MTLSERTVGVLIDQASEWGHGDLTSLLMRSSVSKGDPGHESGLSRSKRAGAALSRALADGNEQGLLDVARNLLNSFRPADPASPWVQDLVASLRADGYLAHRHVAPGDTTTWPPRPETYRWTVEPLGGDEIPLPPQAGSVQRELASRGLGVAESHFSQAFRAFTARDLEASNAQLRPAFESVVITIAQRHKPWRGTSGGQAIEAINKAGLFEKGEYEYVMGLWRMSHKNGSHPGLSNDDEALFRFNAVTSLLLFLVQRFL